MSKQIQDAYIVAATRTAVGKAPRGVFRSTRPDSMLAHVLASVLKQVPAIEQVIKVYVPTPISVADTPTLAEVRWTRRLPFGKTNGGVYFVGLKFIF